MHSRITIKLLSDIEDMKSNFDLVKLLNVSLSKEQYMSDLQAMLPHNYFQIVALQHNQVLAISGFWIATKFYCGKYLEVDNFIVHPEHRKKGIGEMMIGWMSQKAKDENCNTIMLDAYLDNNIAHQFYKKCGFEVKGYHFLKKIN